MADGAAFDSRSPKAPRTNLAGDDAPVTGPGATAETKAIRADLAHGNILEIGPEGPWIRDLRAENAQWFKGTGPYQGLAPEERDALLLKRSSEINDQYGVGLTQSGELTEGRRWFEAHQIENYQFVHRDGIYGGLSHDDAWRLNVRRNSEIDEAFGILHGATVDLVNRDSRVSFITEILAKEARQSCKSFGTADYSDVIGRLGEAFADVIGARKGPFRDQLEQTIVSQRLSDVGWGFLAALSRERLNNRMLQAWIIPVVEGINSNFS